MVDGYIDHGGGESTEKFSQPSRRAAEGLHPAVKIREVLPSGRISICAARLHRGQCPAKAVLAAFR